MWNTSKIVGIKYATPCCAVMSSQDISRLHQLISTSHPLISATSSSHNTHHSPLYTDSNPTLPHTHTHARTHVRTHAHTNWCYYRQGTSSVGLTLTTHSPTLIQAIPTPISSYTIHYSINPCTNKQVTSTERWFPWLVISRFRAETSVRMRIHTQVYDARFL